MWVNSNCSTQKGHYWYCILADSLWFVIPPSPSTPKASYPRGGGVKIIHYIGYRWDPNLRHILTTMTWLSLGLTWFSFQVKCKEVAENSFISLCMHKWQGNFCNVSPSNFYTLFRWWSYCCSCVCSYLHCTCVGCWWLYWQCVCYLQCYYNCTESLFGKIMLTGTHNKVACHSLLQQ